MLSSFFFLTWWELRDVDRIVLFQQSIDRNRLPFFGRGAVKTTVPQGQLLRLAWLYWRQSCVNFVRSVGRKKRQI